MNLDAYTADDLFKAILVFLAVCAAVTIVLEMISKIKNLTKPKTDNDRQIMQYFANDKARLDTHEAAIKRLENRSDKLAEGMNVVGAGVQALLEHELHNGNSEEMAKASSDINKYLWNRGQ